MIACEAAYVGGARAISAQGLGSDAALINNGIEAALRFNLPIEVKRTLLEPFVFGGVGWTHFGLQRGSNSSSNIANGDNETTLPFGAGFAMRYRGFIADARFTYCPTFGDDRLVRQNDGKSPAVPWW